jgi:hypothetical protein
MPCTSTKGKPLPFGFHPNFAAGFYSIFYSRISWPNVFFAAQCSGTLFLWLGAAVVPVNGRALAKKYRLATIWVCGEAAPKKTKNKTLRIPTSPNTPR